jgi:hypothetical protein
MLPSSDSAVVYYNSSGSPPERSQTLINATTESCALKGGATTVCGNLSGALFGYWDSSAPSIEAENATTSSPYFHYFPAGQYTLVAEDLWNQTVFAYFKVLPLASS